MKIFKHIKIDDLIWMYYFGRSKRKITSEELVSDLSVLDEPVFFLSTGRCGTKWFNQLISKDNSVRDFHAPYPNFSMQNKYIYNLWKNHIPHEIGFESGKQIFLSGREQYLRYSYKSGKRYFETNNHITFFAPIIEKLIPSARFVHLYRHPGEFVRSGIRRGWYEENNQANTKLIQPEHNKSSLTQLGKIAWLWNETNSFIEDFKKTIDSDRIYSFNFNNLNSNNLKPLLEFMRIQVSERNIRKMLQAKLNIQKSGSYPTYENWNEEHKMELKSQCEVLATKYEYTL